MFVTLILLLVIIVQQLFIYDVTKLGKFPQFFKLMKLSSFLHILPLEVQSTGLPKYDFNTGFCSYTYTHHRLKKWSLNKHFPQLKTHWKALIFKALYITGTLILGAKIALYCIQSFSFSMDPVPILRPKRKKNLSYICSNLDDVFFVFRTGSF